MNQMLTTGADCPFGPVRIAPNCELLAASDDSRRLGLLRQMLRPQGRLQFLPSLRREAEGAEEARLESPERMRGRQQLVAKLGCVDDGFVNVRQEHKAV
jgi:hypothetical protein